MFKQIAMEAAWLSFYTWTLTTNFVNTNSYDVIFSPTTCVLLEWLQGSELQHLLGSYFNWTYVHVSTQKGYLQTSVRYLIGRTSTSNAEQLLRIFWNKKGNKIHHNCFTTLVSIFVREPSLWRHRFERKLKVPKKWTYRRLRMVTKYYALNFIT